MPATLSFSLYGNPLFLVTPSSREMELSELLAMCSEVFECVGKKTIRTTRKLATRESPIECFPLKMPTRGFAVNSISQPHSVDARHFIREVFTSFVQSLDILPTFVTNESAINFFFVEKYPVLKGLNF